MTRRCGCIGSSHLAEDRHVCPCRSSMKAVGSFVAFFFASVAVFVTLLPA